MNTPQTIPRIILKAVIFIAGFYATFFIIGFAVTVPYLAAQSAGWPTWGGLASGIVGLFVTDAIVGWISKKSEDRDAN